MALIPGYEYDIFISYAHLDNEKFPGQTDGWIEQFFLGLKYLLDKRYGRQGFVKIWWDNKKLDGNVLFDDSIAEGIKKSAIMICLNSSAYKASDYCQQELQLFYEKAQKEPIGLSLGNRSRLVHVLLNNIHYSDWPKELEGSSGFPFHDAEDAEDYGDAIETLSPKFKSLMQDLKDSIWKLIEEFPKDERINEVLHQLEDQEKDDSFSIYLAEVADTLRTPRKRIAAELAKKGFTIIDGVPPPHAASEHEEATRQSLVKSQLSIHLLDQYPGRDIVDDPEIWYPQKQAEIAFKEPIPQMIWVPSDLEFSEIEEEVYLQFMESIYEGTVSKKNYEYIRGSKSTLTGEIIEYAERIQKSQKQRVAQEGPLSVLLDTHMDDFRYANQLSNALLDNNIRAFVNPQEDDPSINIDLMEERMSKVNKLIFLYGRVSKDWVSARVKAAIQLILANNYPIEDFFIYMAPPHKEAKDIDINQRLLKVNIVDNSMNATMDSDAVERFFNELKKPQS
ncbi:MAG: toll/interleukin-1 receptor domain-containing protein [Bacteroidota bacterium]